MRKVFAFWSIILFILIAGVAAVIYGKMVLREEKKIENKIAEELTLPELPPAPKAPVLPLGAEGERIPEKIEIPKPVPRLDVESLKAPEMGEFPEVPEGKMPPLPLAPEGAEAPVLPELPLLPEMPEMPKMPELPPPPEEPDFPEIPGMPE